MEYFKSSIKSVLGTTDSTTNQLTGAETIERLLSRVNTSTLLEDRRDACRALKALSRTYRLEVGAQGIDILRHVLELDQSDAEIIGYTLDILCNITNPERFPEEQSYTQNLSREFTDMFTKRPENITLILNFLDEYDFRVRFPTVRFLLNLIVNRPKDIQDIVLLSPQAISKLMDLLVDCREVIRNDVLILLINLTKSNANIQKIVAFENGFDRLFDVIRTEGDDGIVVEDCYLLMHNLLKNNTSNINFFKEASYIQKLVPMVQCDPMVVEWSDQRTCNFQNLLHVIRSLVGPNQNATIPTINSCQTTIRTTNLLHHLTHLLVLNGVPIEILTATICTLSEVIRGNLMNQEYFTTFKAPLEPPETVLNILLKSLFNEKQPFQLRCSILYFFQGFLYKNPPGQLILSQNLHVLRICNEPVTLWFSTILFSYCLNGNQMLKEQLLTKPDQLLKQYSSQLLNVKTQCKIGICILLGTWLVYCPLAVEYFLKLTGDSNAILFLLTQTSTDDTNDNLCDEIVQKLSAFLLGLCLVYNNNTVEQYTKQELAQLIEKRVGNEVFCNKLGELPRLECYAQALKQPQMNVTRTEQLLLEFQFCCLYKQMEPVICSALRNLQNTTTNGELLLTPLNECENAQLLQYKTLIREQDKKLEQLQLQCDSLQVERDTLKVTNEGQLNEIQQLRTDQDGLMTLLMDQDVKLNRYRTRLEQLGQEIADSSSDQDAD